MTRILIIEHAPSRANEFERIASYAGVVTVTNKVYVEPLQNQLSDFDAIISTGGPMSVTNRHQPELKFLLDEIELLRQARDSGVPVLGVCLGHQLLTVALGGEVAALNRGPEIGWCEVALTPAGENDPIFLHLNRVFSAFQYHYDAATSLPAGCSQLATSSHCEIQGFRLGTRPVWGVQFHPEVPAGLALKVLKERVDELRPELADFDLQMRDLQSETHRGTRGEGEQVILNFLNLVGMTARSTIGT